MLGGLKKGQFFLIENLETLKTDLLFSCVLQISMSIITKEGLQEHPHPYTPIWKVTKQLLYQHWELCTAFRESTGCSHAKATVSHNDYKLMLHRGGPSFSHDYKSYCPGHGWNPEVVKVKASAVAMLSKEPPDWHGQYTHHLHICGSGTITRFFFVCLGFF